MKNQWKVLAILFAVVIIIAAIISFVYNKNFHEIITWEEDYQAKHNRNTYDGLWALSRFLSKYQSKSVIYIENKKQFDEYITKNISKNNAVLFLTDNSVINDDIATVLMEWIARGNHLVVDGKHNNLLKHWHIEYPTEQDNQEQIFGINSACVKEFEKVKQYGVDKFSKSFQEKSIKTCNEQASFFRLPENNSIYFIDSISLKHTFKIDFNSTKNVIATAKNSHGITMVQAKHQNGSVTFVRNMNIFGHPEIPSEFSRVHINRLDNAYLAAYLAHQKSDIYIATPKLAATKHNLSLKPPKWWQIFRKHPLLWTIFILLVATAIWRKTRRLGGLRHYDDTNERTIALHCLAQGRLIDKHHEQYSVLLDWQQAICDEWDRKLSSHQSYGQAEYIDNIAKITNLERSDIQLWLNPIPEKLNRNDLLRYIQSHQRIRTQRK